MKNVILISWDGCDRSAVNKLLDAQKLPSLDWLKKDGIYRNISVKNCLTVTKPSHAQMLTGMRGNDNHVRTNQCYEPIPAGLTIMERVRELGIVVTMITSKGRHMGCVGGKNFPKGKQKCDYDNSKLPFYETIKHVDFASISHSKSSKTGKLALQILEKYKDVPFFHFFHFREPDHTGHKAGRGPLYNKKVVENDLWLGRILECLQTHNLYSDTFVYVTTDHGFIGHDHKKAPACWLVTNDKEVIRDGIVPDIAATILARFGISPDLDPRIVGRPLITGPSGRIHL